MLQSMSTTQILLAKCNEFGEVGDERKEACGNAWDSTFGTGIT